MALNPARRGNHALVSCATTSRDAEEKSYANWRNCCVIPAISP
ncbi:hypothetical protein ACVXHB_13250 [Escherichia coli]